MMSKQSKVYLNGKLWNPTDTLIGKATIYLVPLGFLILAVLVSWVLGKIFNWSFMSQYGGWIALFLWLVQLSIFVFHRVFCLHNTMVELIAFLQITSVRLDRLEEAINTRDISPID